MRIFAMIGYILICTMYFSLPYITVWLKGSDDDDNIKEDIIAILLLYLHIITTVAISVILGKQIF